MTSDGTDTSNGTAQPIRIIAEIGINHDGSAEKALTLIQAAAAARVWGIKFQYRNLESAYAAKAREIGDEILKKEIERTYLPPNTLLDLTHKAQALGLKAGVSTFDPQDLDDFGPGLDDFDFFKVPSAELENEPLVDRMLDTGKEVFLSTGCHDEAAVARALERLDPAQPWVPMHCISNYPVSVPNPKLGYISWMKRTWPKEIGYSSHDLHWMTCLMALQKGATVIERHITLDKGATGLDHTTSSTPDEFELLSQYCEALDVIESGDAPRSPNQGEYLNLQNLGRSYYAIGDIKAGETVTRDKLATRAPRTGFGHAEMRAFIDKPAIRDVDPGDVMDRSVFLPKPSAPESSLAFAKAARLSLPVRFHDIDRISAQFPIGTYEFHLSYGEARAPFDIRAYPADWRYSIHLPDYVSSTELMDPFSPDPQQREHSHEVLGRTVELCQMLQEKTGTAVPIVGSFSCVHSDKAGFIADHGELFESYRTKGVDILPQWLPPIAWYFGGSVRLKTMCDPEDLALLKKSGLPFCMDVCHLFMGAQFFGFAPLPAFTDLQNQIEHLHISDAVGVDGEGVAIGHGDTQNTPVIKAALAMDCMKVVEVWQGHLDDCAGFAAALADLEALGRNG